MPPAIEFRDVSFTTPQGRALLDRISFAVEEGTSIALLGRSGSGKTTLLRTVNRMVEPTSGDVLVNGRSVRDLDLIELRRGIGYVIQETGLFPHLTVERNAAMVPEISGKPRHASRKHGHELLSAVGLDPATFAKRYPHQLSGGQRQRVGLARALAAQPPILLMDEPFGALDPLTRDALGRDYRRLHNKLGLTTVMITHDMLEALLLADRVVVMRAGRIIADDTPRALAAANDHGYVQELMEAPRRQADELRALMRREQR
jgi:osmoprotectant transport system ATP-binding protein